MTITMQSLKSGLVPVLVDQFNDIIEWKATSLQKEVESFEAQKTATPKALPIFNDARRFSATDADLFANALQKSISNAEVNSKNFCNIDMSNVNGSAFPKLKRSKSQKCFTKKLDRVRMKAIKNTITENLETDSTNNKESVTDRIARIKKEYHITTPTAKPESVRVVKFADEPVQNELPAINATESPPPTPTPLRLINHQQVIEDLAELKLESFKLSPNTDQLLCDDQSKLSRSPSPALLQTEFDKNKLKEPATFKVLPTYNVLLEKLQNVYRHNFVVKTQVVDIGSRVAAALGKSGPTESGLQCLCGQPFNFSDKTLQCILCLTKCHTNCASTVPTPCIKFVDPNLRPSKLISNYVYPRSRPSVPALLIRCCREIEAKCSLLEKTSQNGTAVAACGPLASLNMASLKLYYVESERLKVVKDEVKRTLSQGKLGIRRMDGFTVDQLCGMVKYFLAEVCEPVFTPANWKEYSLNLNKKSEDELKQNLLDTFDAMPPSSVQTLCFMLLHLKHLIQCGYQDESILVDIFCPILLGELEVRRKWRLMKILFTIKDNVLMSFVER